MAMKELDGRVAVITGASRGLGKAIAVSLASAGARVALVARNPTALESAAEEVRASGAEAAVFPADISVEIEVLRLEREILCRFGCVDILVNNAGMNIRKAIEEFSLEEWNRVLATNTTGPFLMCRAFVPHMKGRGHGRIINVASIMSHVSIPGRTAYSASKVAVLGFTKALALELARNGITVVAISPGPFATEMTEVYLQDPNLNSQFLSRIPTGRWGKPEEIGSLVLYLCSPAAAFVTGTDILIDGGWTAQ